MVHCVNKLQTVVFNFRYFFLCDSRVVRTVESNFVVFFLRINFGNRKTLEGEKERRREGGGKGMSTKLKFNFEF